MIQHAQLTVYEHGEPISLLGIGNRRVVLIILRGSVALISNKFRRREAGAEAVLGTVPMLLNGHSPFKLSRASSVSLAYAIPEKILLVSKSLADWHSEGV